MSASFFGGGLGHDGGTGYRIPSKSQKMAIWMRNNDDPRDSEGNLCLENHKGMSSDILLSQDFLFSPTSNSKDLLNDASIMA